MCDVSDGRAFCRRRRRCARQEGVALPIASYRPTERKDNGSLRIRRRCFHVRETRAICSVPLAMKRTWQATWQATYECDERRQQTNVDFALINHCSVIFTFYRID